MTARPSSHLDDDLADRLALLKHAHRIDRALQREARADIGVDLSFRGEPVYRLDSRCDGGLAVKPQTLRCALSFSFALRIISRIFSHSSSESLESREKLPPPPEKPAPSMAMHCPVR